MSSFVSIFLFLFLEHACVWGILVTHGSILAGSHLRPAVLTLSSLETNASFVLSLLMTLASLLMLLIQRFIFHSEHIRQWEKYFVQEVIPLTTESHH